MSSEQEVVDAPAEHRPAQGSGGESSSQDQNGSGGASYELDENGQRIPHGMGQSKSSRRRRRKRKGKGSEAGGPEGSAQEDAGADSAPETGSASSIQAASTPHSASPAQRNQHQGGRGFAQDGSGRQHGTQQGGASSAAGANNPQGGPNAGGTKRWKKKFRDRDRGRTQENPGNQGTPTGGFRETAGSSAPQFRGPDTHQPGNGGGGGFKRKGGFGGGKQQQRGPRSFVGPMDHSYRVANGNFAETPPSTIEPHGSHGGPVSRRSGYQSDSQPIDYSQGRTVPIAEDAATHIYFFIEDLFITAKINETARKLGVKVGFVKNDKESVASLTAGLAEDRPSLIVFDLNNANAKPMTLIPKLKTKLKKTVSIIGFLSHLQGDLKAKAVEAGCDTVMPRAAFSQNLPNLLRRYGIEDVDEATNYNQ